jgi:hypothetical protein
MSSALVGPGVGRGPTPGAAKTSQNAPGPRHRSSAGSTAARLPPRALQRGYEAVEQRLHCGGGDAGAACLPCGVLSITKGVELSRPM